MTNEKKGGKKGIIIFVVVILLVAIIGGYFYYSHQTKQSGFRGDGMPPNFSNQYEGNPAGQNPQNPPQFQNLTKSQINEVKETFESNSNQNSIISYCEQNRNNCVYYCMEINRSNEVCNQIFNRNQERIPPQE